MEYFPRSVLHSAERFRSGRNAARLLIEPAEGELPHEDIYYPLNIITVDDSVEYRIPLGSRRFHGLWGRTCE